MILSFAAIAARCLVDHVSSSSSRFGAGCQASDPTPSGEPQRAQIGTIAAVCLPVIIVSPLRTAKPKHLHDRDRLLVGKRLLVTEIEANIEASHQVPGCRCHRRSWS